jgi:2-(1,2-epoxy-1,2-dihydrophenyl)acetyl-CoA isomerase
MSDAASAGGREPVRSERHGAVALVTIDRPETRNALSREVAGALHGALVAAAADPALRVIVLTGAGGAFSAGADLKEGLPTHQRVEDTINERYRPSLELITGLDKPVIAAIPGPAAGIAMSYALACDLVVMAEEGYLLSPFSTIGLVPDGGATWFLARRLGYHRAYQLCVEAERIPAGRCLELGLANRVVPGPTLIEHTLTWAAELARRAPLALAATKQAMRQAMWLSWSDTVTAEARLQNDLATSADAREAVQAFLTKRPPKFEGR